MTTMMRLRRRGLWMVATVVLLLALALAACGGRGAHGSDLSGGGAAQQTVSGAASDVSSADDNLQQITAALDSAQTDASFDGSSSDSEVQP